MDAPRLLARRSEQGYTHHPTAALLDEPEAVSHATQEQITARMHRERHEHRRDVWRRTRDELRKQLSYHEQQARHCEREIARLDRKIGGR